MKRSADQALQEELKKAERQLVTAIDWESRAKEKATAAATSAEKASHNVGVALQRRDRVQEALAVLNGTSDSQTMPEPRQTITPAEVRAAAQAQTDAEEA